LYFEGELAASASPSTILCSGKKSPANPFAPPLLKHCQVVDIQERSSLECREPQETHGDADRALLCDGEEHQSGRVIPQGLHETLAYIWAKRFSAADWVGSVRVEDVYNSGAVCGIVKVRICDFDVNFDQLVSSSPNGMGFSCGRH
jgi:hypothetical protein